MGSVRQNKGERGGFMPFSAEEGKARQIRKIVLAYLLLRNLPHAHASRLFLFRSEGQGYKNAVSLGHNKARFPNRKVLLPPRERAQEYQAEARAKTKARREAIKALKYGRRYGTISTTTIERAQKAGISIRRANPLMLPEADTRRQFCLLLRSDMKGI